MKIPECRWNKMDNDLREKLVRGSDVGIQNDLDKYTPMYGIPLKEAFCSDYRKHPLSKVKPLFKNMTLDNASELEKFFPPNTSSQITTTNLSQMIWMII